MILTDRSRHFKGLTHCNRTKFEEYLRGGFGIRPKSESIPLATGTAIHAAIEPMLKTGMQRLCDRDEARAMIAASVEAYKKKCESRGFVETDADQVAFVIAEQSALIAGLAWAFYRVLLPWILDEFEVLAVEQEVELVLGCTCGLGELIAGAAEHESRGCNGVALMSRGDLICRRKSDQSVGAWDIKSSSYGFSSNEHEHWVQMALSCIAAEKIIGEPVTHSYLIGLLKGKRDFQSKSDREEGGLKKQNSVLCYAWHRPADPPFTAEEWRYEYTREKGFSKVPVWMIGSDPALAVEAWVMDTMPQEEVAESLSILGPSSRQSWLEPDLLRGIEAEARRWAEPIVEREDASFASVLEERFPRSWNCYPYGQAHGCAFIPICYHEGSVDPNDPLASGRFVRREPHHAAESIAAEQAGWLGEEGEDE